MDNEKLNSSGCLDKTAFEAIKNVRREERKKLIAEVENENTGVEAAHQTEQKAESLAQYSVRTAKYINGQRKAAPYRKAARLKVKAEKAEIKAAYEKTLAENPSLKKSALKKFRQKQQIKKKYQKTKRAEQTAKQAKKAAQNAERAASRLAAFVWRHKAVFGAILAIVLLIVWLGTALSSCSVIGTTGFNSIMVSSYFAEDEDIYAAENYYNGLEQNLQSKIDNIENEYSGYDEYNYNLAGIGHNPYELISYLTAVYQDFKFADIRNNLDDLFNAQYHLVITETSRQRTDEDGNEYTYKILNVTLALLCDRHNKIAYFRKEKYFTVEITLGGVKAETERLDNENTAKEIITACEHSQTVCVSVTKETKTEQPPKLFDLTTLQRAANRIYGYTAKQTLDYAQALYEKKLITYPRTDSRYLTEDMAETAAAVIRLGADIPPFDKAPDFFPEISRMINNSKVSDHHAIIPTLEIEKADLPAIPTGELNILKLVLCRIISASSESYVYENTAAVFECGGYTFTAKGKEIVSDGFRAIEKLIYPKTDNAESAPLVKFYKGQLFAGAAPELKEKYTRPPKPYTEDTLLSAMETAGAKETTDSAERKGLGTPATRAAILEKLVQTGFAQRNGRQITPTKNGILLVSVLPDTLISAQLTAEWENQLSLISKGESSPKEFMQGIKSMIIELTQRYREFDSARENPFKEREDNVR